MDRKNSCSSESESATDSTSKPLSEREKRNMAAKEKSKSSRDINKATKLETIQIVAEAKQCLKEVAEDLMELDEDDTNEHLKRHINRTAEESTNERALDRTVKSSISRLKDMCKSISDLSKKIKKRKIAEKAARVNCNRGENCPNAAKLKKAEETNKELMNRMESKLDDIRATLRASVPTTVLHLIAPGSSEGYGPLAIEDMSQITTASASPNFQQQLVHQHPAILQGPSATSAASVPQVTVPQVQQIASSFSEPQVPSPGTTLQNQVASSSIGTETPQSSFESPMIPQVLDQSFSTPPNFNVDEEDLLNQDLQMPKLDLPEAALATHQFALQGIRMSDSQGSVEANSEASGDGGYGDREIGRVGDGTDAIELVSEPEDLDSFHKPDAAVGTKTYKEPMIERSELSNGSSKLYYDFEFESLAEDFDMFDC